MTAYYCYTFSEYNFILVNTHIAIGNLIRSIQKYNFWSLNHKVTIQPIHPHKNSVIKALSGKKY